MNRTLVFASIASLTLFSGIANAQLNDPLNAQSSSAPAPQAAAEIVAAKAQTYQPGLNRVSFNSEGIELVGHLYLPSSYQPGEQLPAVIVSGSWTTVKEQMAGEYAQQLAEQGYAALAFDSRSFGESGGELRSFESPTAKVTDLRNAISFLETVDAVDGDRIAGLGICAGAGYVTTTAAQDDRLKAVVTIAPWLHSPEIVNAVYGGEETVAQMIQTGRQAAKQFAQTGEAEYLLATSNSDDSAVMFGEIDYYQNPDRGAIPEWANQFAVATWAEWLTFNPMANAAQVDVPTLFIHSENGAIPDGARQFFAAMPTDDKEMVWLNDYNQFDFYDQPEAIGAAIALVTQHFNSIL